MMSFEFNTPSRILFGPGQINRLGDLVAHWGSSALVVHAGERHSMAPQRVAVLLENKPIKLHFVRQRGEPKVSEVDALSEEAKAHQCEFVIGVGGGSAIDAAKAVAGLLANGGSALDYLEVVGKGQKITCPAIPWIAIPTTAGTGAEATKNAVLTAGTFKASMRSEHLLPRIAIVDSSLTTATPPAVMAASGMDALCQLIESFTSSGANPITRGLSLQGIRIALLNLRKSCKNPRDLDARDAMSMAALMSGMALTHSGLGAVHGFAAPLGAHFPIPHGVICANLLPPVIRANAEALGRDAEAYADMGRWAAMKSSLAHKEAIAALISFLQRLLHELEVLPLSKYGISEADIPKMVELAKQSSSMKYNPIKLSDEAMAGILRAGIAGYSDAQ